MVSKSRKELIADYKERKLIGGICIVRNKSNGKIILEATTDINGSQNRFEFAKKTGNCVFMKLQKDWKTTGSDAFEFEVVETLEIKENQTNEDFKRDVEVLKELWIEKFNHEEFY